MKTIFEFRALLSICVLVLFVSLASAQPSPRSVLGFQPTDDKVIADWGQITDYFAKLDAGSPKVLVRSFTSRRS